MNCLPNLWRGAQRLLALPGICLALANGVWAAEIPSPTNAPLHFTNALDRFSITLPAGWKEMPAMLAEGFCDPVQAAKPGGVGAYGFELAANTNSLTLPYVTVQVVRAGRVAEGYLRMLNNPEIRRRAVLDLVKRDGLDLSNISGVTFETNRQRLRFSGTRTDEFGSEVRFWHDLIFTEHGSINITCIADEPDSGRWAEAFTGILDSLNINSLFAYQPREVPAQLAGTKFRVMKFLLIPGSMIMLGLARIIGRRFSGRVMSDEV